MLKSDFHIHTSEDPKDRWLNYDAKKIIDKASEYGFEVISITLHEKVFYNPKIRDYAKKKGVLLIPGIECRIEGKDVIILNAPKEAEKLNTFEDLKRFRKKYKSIFVLAPHPYYPGLISLGSKLSKHIDLFDGVEFCHLHIKYFNAFNNHAMRFAKKHKKPMIGTSDAHRMFQFNTTFSLVDAKKDISSVISALKKNKVQIKTNHLPLTTSTLIVFSAFFGKFLRIFGKKKLC